MSKGPRKDDTLFADDPMSDFFLDKPLSVEKKDLKRGKSIGSKKAPSKIQGMFDLQSMANA